jgi:hypothetical protein
MRGVALLAVLLSCSGTRQTRETMARIKLEGDRVVAGGMLTLRGYWYGDCRGRPVRQVKNCRDHPFTCTEKGEETDVKCPDDPQFFEVNVTCEPACIATKAHENEAIELIALTPGPMRVMAAFRERHGLTKKDSDEKTVEVMAPDPGTLTVKCMSNGDEGWKEWPCDSVHAQGFLATVKARGWAHPLFAVMVDGAWVERPTNGVFRIPGPGIHTIAVGAESVTQSFGN